MMEDYQTSWSLLNKIAKDLVDLNNNDSWFVETSDNLHKFLKNNVVDANTEALTEEQYAELRGLFADTYRKLISLEEVGNLTTKQTVLLNDLDELDEAILGMK